MTYRRDLNISSITGATSGAGTADHSRAPAFISDL